MAMLQVSDLPFLQDQPSQLCRLIHCTSTLSRQVGVASIDGLGGVASIHGLASHCG